MQDWQVLTTADRLTLGRAGPRYERAAWGLRIALVGGAILLVMLRYAGEPEVTQAAWFD